MCSLKWGTNFQIGALAFVIKWFFLLERNDGSGPASKMMVMSICWSSVLRVSF